MTNRVPRGYSTVSPYLIVDDIERELEFLRLAFEAEILEQQPGEDGEILHGEARIGDSIIMLGKAEKDQETGRASLYIWTTDVDERFRQALKCGATTVSQPADQEHGTREARIRDPLGNTWWLGQEQRKPHTKEIERRLMEQRKSRM